MSRLAELYSRAEYDVVDEEHLLPNIRSKIAAPAFVYAMMDDAVALGKYENGRIELGVDRTVQTLASCRHVLEMRVFNSACEYKAIRVDGVFRCRFRIDHPHSGGETLSIMEETHKLWGAARHGADANGWSLLLSDRGTRLYFPGVVAPQGEKGFVVRSYIQFYEQKPVRNPGEDSGGNLYKFVDERFVDFANWPLEQGE